MLDCLTRKPQILDPVFVLLTVCTKRGCKGAKDLAGRFIYPQNWLFLKAVDCSQCLLPETRRSCHLGAEFQFGNRNWGEIYRFIPGNPCNIGWRQESSFYINPNAGIYQEAHGSRAS